MTEESKYLDKLFQSKFAGFEAEPPASVWNNVHKELHGKSGGGINPVNLSVLAALVLISGLLGFSIIKDSPTAQNTEVSNSDQSGLLAHYPQATHEQPPAEKNAAIAPLNSSPQEDRNSTPANTIAADPIQTKDTDEGISRHDNTHERYIEHNYTEQYFENTRLAELKARSSISVNTTQLNIGTGQFLERENNLRPKYGKLSDGESRYNRRASWQLGVFFTPEVIFYPDDSIPNQRNYNVDVSARWIKNDFFIESGLGMSFSSDDGNYAIDYEKFLGSYDDVYNVTFDTTESGGLVPIYHTNIVEVYDSISKFRLEKTKNTYTYLQVPLYVGFRKQVNRFNWFVKGGPVFSVLVGKNVPEPDMGTDRIVGLDQRMPSRVNTHWQFAISAGLNYQLSNTVSIGIEPTFRYYLNSQYERKYISTRHPYSVGLRAGLLFNF